MVDGMAKCPLQLGREVKRLSVTIGTVSLPLLRPQNPARILDLSEQDSILIVELSFSVERKSSSKKGHSLSPKRKVPSKKKRSSPSPKRKVPSKKRSSPSPKRKVSSKKDNSPSAKKNDRAVPDRIGT